jgi:putative nucleotidyltransferase with HDIG domain
VTEALDAARGALAGRPAWVVGGAVRDALLGRPVSDLDLVVTDDARGAARRLARSAGGPSFELSSEFGAWRVIGPQRRWQVDVTPLQGGTLRSDLARRDFTINAMAQPLDGGDLVDPYGGAGDLEAGRLRMVAEAAFDDDPLRVLRLVRLACELGLVPEPATFAAAAARAPRITDVSVERVFAELKRVVAADRVRDGLALMERLDLVAHVLPELAALRGVEQNRYHHLDVYDHTLAVLDQTVALQRDPAPALGEELAGPLKAFLARPLADELTRGTALRLGALLHDVAKPQTQTRNSDGSILGFPGHADQGADMSRAVLTRLRASEKLRAHVAGLARHHLRLGYLVHEAPLDGRALYRYLARTSPVEVDVSLLSVADRLATRGRKADEAIGRHLEVARVVLPAALDFPAFAAQPALVRGDRLAAELGLRPGPALGELLAELEAARYAGEIATREDAVALARELTARSGPPSP